MENQEPIKYKRLELKLSNFWINFLFQFTLTTLVISLYSFISGEDRQFIPFRIIDSLIWAWLFPIVKEKK
jgi:hypothetical protein